MLSAGAASYTPRSSAAWGSSTRSLALAGLVGVGITGFVELMFSPDFTAEFFRQNELDMGRRMEFLLRIALGGLGTAAAALYALARTRRSGGSGAPVERTLWMLSPLMLLPAIPTVLAEEAWRMRHEELLVVVLAGGLLLEVLLVQALRAAPGWATERFRLFVRQMPKVLRRHGPLVAVVAGVLFYAVFMSTFTVQWHYKLKTANYDLGINNNLIFGALHGKFMESPVSMPENPAGYLAIHVKLGQYVYLPIYALFPRAETLLIIQSVCCALGALPLFAFARRRVSAVAAAGIALSYLCWYPMQSANFYEVHDIPIASCFVLATIWALDTRRWVWFALAFLAGMITREDTPIGMAVIGTFAMLSGFRPRVGLLMTVISLSWFVFLRFLVMDQAGDWWFPSMYKGLWSAPEEGFRSVLKTITTNPAFTLTKLVETRKVYFIMHLFVPLAFLPLRRWYLWAAALPGFVLTMLATDYKPPTMFTFQYVMHWGPYLFAAAPLALAAISRRPDDGIARARGALGAMVFATFALQYNYGAFPKREGSFQGGYKTISFIMSDAERQRYADLRRIIARIPPDASVAATEYVGPHVSSRITMISARYGPYGADYYLAASDELKLKQTKPKLADALKRGEYGVLDRVGDFALLKRGHDTSGNAQLLRDWRLE